MSDDFAKNMLKALKKAGIPVTICEIKLTPEQEIEQKRNERAVIKFVMEIEKAHKKAANSKLTYYKGQIEGASVKRRPFKSVEDRPQ